MTLILSLIARNFAIQVSDRRLTMTDGTLLTDESNKAILFENQFIFGYTGLAEIDQVPTYRWVAEALNEGLQAHPENMTFIVRHLAERLTSQFARIPSTQYRKLAFVAIGWAADSHDPNLAVKPMLLTVSNALDRNLKWLPQAESRFKMGLSILPENKTYIFAANGVGLKGSEEDSIHRNIRRCLARGGGPRAVGRLLATLMRAVAERSSRVGKSMLISSLPRSAMGDPMTIMSAPLWSTPTFLYAPADVSSPVAYGPTGVFKAGMFTDMTLQIGRPYLQGQPRILP
jgi:hypothetical protein